MDLIYVCVDKMQSKIGFSILRISIEIVKFSIKPSCGFIIKFIYRMKTLKLKPEIAGC